MVRKDELFLFSDNPVQTFIRLGNNQMLFPSVVEKLFLVLLLQVLNTFTMIISAE
jgi:hypothetical protein